MLWWSPPSAGRCGAAAGDGAGAEAAVPPPPVRGRENGGEKGRAAPRGVVHPMAQFVVDGPAVQRPARYAPTGGIVPGGYVFKHQEA